MAEKAVDVPDFVLFSGLHTGKFLEHVLETGKFSDLILITGNFLGGVLETHEHVQKTGNFLERVLETENVNSFSFKTLEIRK